MCATNRVAFAIIHQVIQVLNTLKLYECAKILNAKH